MINWSKGVYKLKIVVVGKDDLGEVPSIQNVKRLPDDGAETMTLFLNSNNLKLSKQWEKE